MRRCLTVSFSVFVNAKIIVIASLRHFDRSETSHGHFEVWIRALTGRRAVFRFLF